ncbi:uncharacterized protein LOC113359219 [Papaver somniferum]|uniref:uncharacterized protein LOC113359219 n=1 Tax=Papaver somniferum TaxID=3469 RepID=UPI000E6F4C86|nr:uncharacterized protein LOC113359219 [Papaver somniferum]
MFPGDGDDEVHEYIPEEVAAADVENPWTMFFDGSSYGTVGGAGVVFEAPRGELLSYSFKLDFRCSNNVDEYEALILGLRIAKEINLGSVEVKCDSILVTNQVNGDFHVKEPHLAPYRAEAQRLMKQTGSTLDHTGRGGNNHEYASATLTINVKLIGEEEGTVTIRRKKLPNTWKEDRSFEEADDWRRIYIEDLTQMDEGRVIPTQPLKKFVIIQGALYYRAAGGSLARKLQRLGVYWPSMSAQVAVLQDSCADCQTPPQPAEVCTAEEVYSRQPYIDFIQHGKLPSDRQESLKIQKKATRFFMHEGVLHHISYSNAVLRCLSDQEAVEWVEAIPLKDYAGATVAALIKEHIIYRFDAPMIIRSDNVKSFVNKDVIDLLRQNNIRLHTSTPYYPKGNGKAEAMNKTLIRILSRTVHDHYIEWHEQFSLALWAYRNSKRSSTGESPYLLVYGEDAILPAEIAIPSARVAMTIHTIPDEISRFAHLDTIEENRTRVERFAEAYRNRTANYYNQSVKERTFKADDLVLKISSHVQRNANAGKFSANWKGPFKIRKVAESGYYKLRHMNGTKVKMPNKGKWLKKFHA